MLEKIKSFPPGAKLLFSMLVTDSDFLLVIENALYTKIEYGIGIRKEENKVDILVLSKDASYAKILIDKAFYRYDRVTLKQYRALLYSNPN